MAELVLKCGRIVTLSDEDYGWAMSFTQWRAWRRYPGAEPIVVTDGPVEEGRRYRRRLLREIALRMMPKRGTINNRIEVTPKNGDNFDCTRENLHIMVAAHARRGPRKIKKGYVYHHPKSKRRKSNGPDRNPCPAPG